MLGTGLPLVDLLLGFALPRTISVPVLLFVLAVSLLLLDALLALFACLRHRIVVLVMRLVDSLPVLRRFRRQSQLLVELAPQLLQLCQSLAQIVVLEVAAGFRILVLAIGVLVEVDALEIVEVQVVDVGVRIARNIASFVS